MGLLRLNKIVVKNIILITILLSGSGSCTSQKNEIIAKSTIKLEGVNTNINDLININGYYSNAEFGAGVRSNLIFFADGTYVWQFGFKKDAVEDSIANNIGKWIRTWIEDGQIRWGNYWGVYRIEGDIIIGNSFVKNSFWKGWSFDEERYKIIDNTTIEKIHLKSLLKSSESYYNSHSTYISDLFQFIPADSLPSSNCWLKEEKWIWRNEEDWKSYMDSIKTKE